MSIESIEAFLDELRNSRLLRAAQLDEIARILQPRFTAPMELAKELVRRGWLTVYQVNQLFNGKGQQLVLGPYRILDHLGKGGVSEVFKAWHGELDCPVALKVIYPDLLANAEAVARFEREIKAVARLSHPNIVRSFEGDANEQMPYFAMEFVEGAPLDKLVRYSGALPVDEACDAIRQAALGLQHAYEQGLVHRDIKPANLVRIAGSSVVKVLDFGLARLHRAVDSDRPTALTAEGALLGTADYVAPEQARDARKADIRSDIYSLGCTFYYLLTAGPPFPAKGLMQKLYGHINKEPISLEVLRPEAPPEIQAVLSKMMAKKPDERYQTPAEVAEALTPFCPKESETKIPHE
jgi:serine/threonine protein kinase